MCYKQNDMSNKSSFFVALKLIFLLMFFFLVAVSCSLFVGWLVHVLGVDNSARDILIGCTLMWFFMKSIKR